MQRQASCGVCNKCGKVTSLKCTGCKLLPYAAPAFYCSKECQTLEYKNHQPHCVGFTMKKVRLKGLGLVASRDIEAGTIILAEKALFVIGHSQARIVRQTDSSISRGVTVLLNVLL